MEGEEILEYIPTEPIPAEAGSPITYEQGERLIQTLESLQTKLGDNQEVNNQALTNISLLLDNIKTNTIPVPVDTVSNPSGIAMTYEQGQVLIETLSTVQTVALTLTLAFGLVFVSKFLYRLFAGTFFG